jgi:glycosyltransferase involved in cell wall biosynthesis
MNVTLSVIIPVYNCERFIRKAIDSALQQPEVTEIVVINDGSTDTTQCILEELQVNNPILKIYHHENRANKGRSASRNLGLQKATGNYIVFLDADDYFLANRFTNDIKLFLENGNCDGVYNAVGFHYYRDATEAEARENQLYTVNTVLQPEALFRALLYGKHGHFHINGLTVKKNVFDTIGLFNETLEVMEDTDVFWKMALKCELLTGIIDQALAVRGVHGYNVFDQVDLYKKTEMLFYELLLAWCSTKQLSNSVCDELLKRIWILRYKENKKLFANIGYWVQLFFPNPKLLFSVLSVKYFPIIRLRKELFPFLYHKV